MAFFDPREQRMCVRIVYDGVSNAGKTTNLKQLCALFATQRSTELLSPGEVEGRTLYFDWVQIVAGVVCGFPLTCQIISVPGQIALTPRRKHLLRSADVVVYVSDSSESDVARARAGLAPLAQILAESSRPAPIVLQANKQDQYDALASRDLASALGLEDVPAVEAIATDGIGVVDTFVTAVRTVSRSIQSRIELAPLSIDVRTAPNVNEVLDGVLAQELDPEWAAEVVLEQALAELLLEIQTARVESSPERASAEKERVLGPTLPTGDAPTGFVWPAHTGRATLRRLEGRVDARAPVALVDGEATVRVDGFVCRANGRGRFDDKEHARQALVRAARERTQLGALLAPETVLVVDAASDGACWLWTIVPDLATFSQLLGQKDPVRSRELVDAYATAVSDLTAICLSRHLRAELGPGAFGLESGVVRFVGDLSASESPADDLVRSLRNAEESLAGHGGDVARFNERLGDRLRSRLTGAEGASPRVAEAAATVFRVIEKRACTA